MCFCRQFMAIQPTHHVILPCIVSDSLMNTIKTKYYEKKGQKKRHRRPEANGPNYLVTKSLEIL